jgi:AmmeMemoRadiSam system protein B
MAQSRHRAGTEPAQSHMGEVRRAAVAGTWYPGSRAALERAVDGHLTAASQDDAARRDATSCPLAIIAPHAGLMYSGPVAAYAYQLVRGCAYDAVVLVGPSHYVAFDGVSIWPRGAWDTPFGPVTVAEDLAAMISTASSAITDRRDAHAREHSLEMQMPFVARLLPGVPVVPLVMGHQTRATSEDLGDALARALAQSAVAARVLLVASSDLSHFNDARTAAAMDRVVTTCVDAFDPDALMDALEREPMHACGGGPMVAVLRAARALGARHTRVLRYGDSGDVSGDKARVVGYMAAAAW